MVTPHLAIVFTEDILKKRLSPEEEGIDRDKVIFVLVSMPGELPSVALWCQAVSL